MKNEEAKQKYDDAIASGKTATLMKESTDNLDLYEITIGNILAQ